jgi:3-phenylpropionate/trans-cinnamate dioxygenase ferredoxin reductase component
VLHYRYLIVGGGMTADAAVEGIRRTDPTGAIGLIGDDTHRPYNRPPLSKALWKGKPLDSIWRQNADQPGVDLYLGRTVTALRPGSREVVDDLGTVYSWEKLLLATGGRPRRLPFGGDAVIYFRTLEDYERLRALADRGGRFAVIGGGFIGAEVAAALAMNHKDVAMFFPGPGIGARLFPPGLSSALNALYRQNGVDVRAGEMVAGIEASGGRMTLRTQGGQTAAVDGIVAGLGIAPATGLAQAAGLDVGDGIVVDEHLRTTHPDIYAAGDVAAFYNPVLAKRIRVEHEDNANTMGRTAGETMAGRGEPYHHLPFFYSDLFDAGYEAVGELDARLETVEDWKEPNREGVVYYLRDGRVRGVLLWNTWNQVDAARRLITEPGPCRPTDLKGRLRAR